MKFTYLILIISTLAILFFGITAYYIPDWNSILINLSTDAIFLIFATFIIEGVIESNNQKKWSRSNKLIKERRLRKIGKQFIFLLGNIFNIGNAFTIFTDSTPTEIYEEGLRVLKEFILPNLDSCNLNDNKRSQILIISREMNEEIDKIISLFSLRLSSEYLEILLDIQQHLERIIKMIEEYDTTMNNPAVQWNAPTKNNAICNDLKDIADMIIKLEEI